VVILNPMNTHVYLCEEIQLINENVLPSIYLLKLIGCGEYRVEYNHICFF